MWGHCEACAVFLAERRAEREVSPQACFCKEGKRHNPFRHVRCNIYNTSSSSQKLLFKVKSKPSFARKRKKNFSISVSTIFRAKVMVVVPSDEQTATVEGAVLEVLATTDISFIYGFISSGKSNTPTFVKVIVFLFFPKNREEILKISFLIGKGRTLKTKVFCNLDVTFMRFCKISLSVSRFNASFVRSRIFSKVSSPFISILHLEKGEKFAKGFRRKTFLRLSG